MRKLLSGLLVLVMLVALLPVTALAAQEAGPVAASAVLENGTVTLTLTAGAVSYTHLSCTWAATGAAAAPLPTGRCGRPSPTGWTGQP